MPASDGRTATAVRCSLVIDAREADGEAFETLDLSFDLEIDPPSADDWLGCTLDAPGADAHEQLQARLSQLAADAESFLVTRVNGS